MRKTGASLALAAALLALPAAAHAGPLDGLNGSCHPETSAPPNPVPYRICSAKVPSFDGTPLDVTVTLPAKVKRHQRLPLIVFLHGLLSSKAEYLSNTLGGAEPS